MVSAPAYTCPVDVPLHILGGKWKLLLVYRLLDGARRNGELKRLVGGISQKVLTQQVRELVRDGLVVRTVESRVPLKVVYEIDRRERAALESLLDELCKWGVEWAGRAGAIIGTVPVG